jgi:spermidine synthase
VCWIRQASVAFGSAALAVSTIVSVFLVGLAAGSQIFGGVARRLERPLRTYAVFEVAIAILALLSLPAFFLTEHLYGSLYRALPAQSVILPVARGALMAMVVFAPAFLMGATLPLYSRWFVSRDDRVSRGISVLYALNTLGAALGTAVTGFVFLPFLGLQTSIGIGVLLSISAAALVWPLGVAKRRLEAIPPVAAEETRKQGNRRGIVLLLLFFLVGVVALGGEVLWTRYLGLFVHATTYTYTITLSVVLLGIVLGSFVAGRWFDRTKIRGRYLGALQGVTGLSLLVLMMLPAAFWIQRAGEPWIVFLLLLPPAVLSGAAFPLAVRMRVARARDASVGAGTMAAVNTIGGVIGALGVGFVLLPGLGLEMSIKILAALSLLGGFAAWLWLDPTLGRAGRGALIGSASALWLVIPLLSGSQLPDDFLGRRGKVVEIHEGIASNLAAVWNDGILRFEIDQWWQGSDQRSHQLVAGHLPMLLRPESRSVLVVGLGTGQTASRFLMHDTDRLDCIDIEPAVFDFVQRHFDTSWMDDPRVTLISGDGRDLIAHSDATWDVISLEVGQTFRPGVAFLYTQDFYRHVRARLTADGLVTQFLPVPFFDEQQFRDAIATFISVFPQSILWYNTSELLLVGFADGLPCLNRTQLRDQIANDPDLAEDLRFAHWGGAERWLADPDALLGGFLAGPKGLTKLSTGGQVYRDDRPVLDFASAGAWERETSEVEIEALLRRHLEPVENVLLDGATDEAMEKIRSTRDLNLADIVASGLVRQVEAVGNENPAWSASLLEEVLRLNPEAAMAHRLMGDASMYLQKFDLAEEHYALAALMDPHDGRAQHGLAILLHRNRMLEESVERYLLASELRPHDADIQNNYGAALAELGRFEEAKEHLEEALRLRPEFPDARRNLQRLPASQ